MTKINATGFRSGLSVNRHKDYILKLPNYRLTAFGKLANGSSADMNWTVQLLNEQDRLQGRNYSGGELKAIISITEMGSRLVSAFCHLTGKDILAELVNHLISTLGENNFLRFQQDYVSTFLKMEIDKDFLENSRLVTEDILLNWLNNINPAFKNYSPLYDNHNLFKDAENIIFIQEMVNFMKQQFPDDARQDNAQQSIYQKLREPAELYPDSIFDQLEFIIESWHEYIDDESLLYQALDLMREERKVFAGGPGEIQAIEYKSTPDLADDEYYTIDKDWMPDLVLLAKNAYVWLHQLTLKYGRMIRHLDEIPDAEFKQLQSRGITGLWLIGIWQRSKASEKIKRMNGGQHAIASAYSLDSYRIADELGGDNAWDILTQKALRFGVRLGCDMVPNHTGIDAQWIVDHPQWYIQRDDLPFPSYSFQGENLSSHPAIEVRIEDHYYAKTDAAVVFERYDRRDGSRRYIYHGNDGTGLPWNDTAQLDYTLSEVREAVVEEIISIAKRIHIIRFDAAMTLAKKHFQRLWFPLVGAGGDIPTRSDYALTQEEFEKAFPREFWRDVIDRVSIEAPDTLLLAEAFWMMEGYFVRNLGMHRVYNSAFMHMMMREDNAAFRKTIYNTLEYDKRILKRYVNFMSNPDEETAIAQFGDDDKYFGVCLVMSTLPGLPMFGHGQIEGFQEKYGMEYAAPRLLEKENKYLIKRHEKEIFPIIKKRYLFAEADNFRLYDFHFSQDEINENVIAYSNYNQETHTLIFYNNSYSQAEGYIQEAADFQTNSNGIIESRQIKWSDIIGIKYGPDSFLIFKDMINNQEFLRPVDEVVAHGFQLTLNGFAYHAFSEFKVEQDIAGKLKVIYEMVGKNGVDSIDKMKVRIRLQPLHQKLKALFTPSMITNQNLLIKGELINFLERKFFLNEQLFPAIFDFHRIFMEKAELDEWTEERLVENTLTYFKRAEKAIIRNKPAIDVEIPGCLIAVWTLLREVRLRAQENGHELSDVIHRYLIDEPLRDIFQSRCQSLSPFQCMDMVYLSMELGDFWPEIISSDFEPLAIKLMQMEQVTKIIKLHNYQNENWFDKEAVEILLSTLEITNRINRCEADKNLVTEDLKTIGGFYLELLNLAVECGYNYDKMMNKLNLGRMPDARI